MQPVRTSVESDGLLAKGGSEILTLSIKISPEALYNRVFGPKSLKIGVLRGQG